MPENKTDNKKTEKSIRDLAHDIRSSLSVILMNVELFMMSTEYKEGSKKLKKFVETMKKQTDAITDKIKNCESHK